MPYNSETGIISAPVSIDDVKRALGESSNDLATLCKSENINIWSKYKNKIMISFQCDVACCSYNSIITPFKVIF